jgi:hypothetical protein
LFGLHVHKLGSGFVHELIAPVAIEYPASIRYGAKKQPVKLFAFPQRFFRSLPLRDVHVGDLEGRPAPVFHASGQGLQPTHGTVFAQKPEFLPRRNFLPRQALPHRF